MVQGWKTSKVTVQQRLIFLNSETFIITIHPMNLLNLCAKIIRTQQIIYASHNFNWECIKAIRIYDTSYHPNGNIWSVYIIHHNFRTQYLGWDETGQIRFNHWYKDGRQDDRCQSWYKSGQIRYDHWWKDEKKDGCYQGWYENSQIKYDQWWKDGKLDGHCQGWHENGHNGCDCWYKNGKLDSHCQVWYESGQIRYDHWYKDGHPDGHWQEWNESGQIMYDQWY